MVHGANRWLSKSKVSRAGDPVPGGVALGVVVVVVRAAGGLAVGAFQAWVVIRCRVRSW